MSNSTPFILVTGANGSGKTTHLKQFALCIILAQMGCYIPCNSAIISPITHIFTRFNGYSDSLEDNASSFCLEMQEIEYIIENLDLHALILIDELADNSSFSASRAIAWSICEYLATISGIYVMLSTHNTLLCNLKQYYPFLEIIHFLSNTNIGKIYCFLYKIENQIEYKYKAEKGVETNKEYGIKLASIVGLPPTVIKVIFRFVKIYKKISKEIAENLENAIKCMKFEENENNTIFKNSYEIISKHEQQILSEYENLSVSK